MALDIDQTKIGRRSNRLGSGPRKAFRGRHSSRGVMPLNQGSSPHGSRNVMKLGGKAGGFGSGRAAGGGGGNLAAALAGIGPSVVGEPEAGPPPAAFGPPQPEFRTQPVALPPSFLPPPRESSFAPQVSGLFPRSEPAPEIDPNLLWLLGQRLAF